MQNSKTFGGDISRTAALASEFTFQISPRVPQRIPRSSITAAAESPSELGDVSYKKMNTQRMQRVRASPRKECRCILNFILEEYMVGFASSPQTSKASRFGFTDRSEV